jgi:nitroimidazol reductase NimA-like FMN-containing flavoprotein (pyridoxamine 5'-phosphate oxidase superfamily)
MAASEPVAELDTRFSAPGATPTEWTEARERLEDAQLYWLTTVRPDGRPHVTPLLSVWLDGALHFCTGPTERKAKNLAQNPHVVLTTGQNTLDEGLDIVVEGEAVPVADHAELQRLADTYESKHGSDWHFDVRDGGFHSDDGGPAVVYRVAATTAFGFRKGELASQTRWRF